MTKETAPVTGWFLASNPTIDGGKPFSAARWYWPESTRVEVWDGRAWIERDMFLRLNEDTGWDNVSPAEVEAFISRWGAGADK